MKSILRQAARLFLFSIPLLLGLYGFVCVEGEPFLQSLFTCICMYGLGYQDSPPNLWLEAARWLALLATASGIVLIVQHFKTSIKNMLAYAGGNSVAVFGPEEERSPLLDELGPRGIPMDDQPVKAHRYVLLGSERENLDYYQLHFRYLCDQDVYIKCHELPAQASTNPKLHLFCPEETAARYFWKTYCPYELSIQKAHHFRITILGFGKLGKELLLSALQNNIFHPDQQIEYHIIGEENGFTDIYRQLGALSDSVFFHPTPWYENVDLIRSSGMVVVADLPDQLSALRDLSLACPSKPIHILASQLQGIDLLKAQNSNIHTFDWLAYARKEDAILGSSLYDQAMLINLRYAHLYNGIEETVENKLEQWSLLDSFTRYSNIGSADYHDIRKIMILRNGWSFPLSKAQVEELAELEHIRWNRYHWLNNWEYGIPKNGKAKDPVARIHKSLVPYAELPEAEKAKDRQVLDILFSISPMDAT